MADGAKAATTDFDRFTLLLGKVIKSPKEQEYNRLISFIQGLKDLESVKQCLGFYIQIYETNPKFSTHNASYRFHQTFYELVEKLVNFANPESQEFKALQDVAFGKSPAFIFYRKRFQTLYEYYQSEIRKVVRLKSEKRTASETYLDELNRLYKKKWNKITAHPIELFALDTYPRPDLRKKFDQHLEPLLIAFSARCLKDSADNRKSFQRAYEKFEKMLWEERKEPNKLFQLLKWTRNLSLWELRKSNLNESLQINMHLYMLVLFKLMAYGTQRYLLNGKLRGFSPQEEAVYFDLLFRDRRFYSNKLGVFKYARKNFQEAQSMARVYLELFIFELSFSAELRRGLKKSLNGIVLLSLEETRHMNEAKKLSDIKRGNQPGVRSLEVPGVLGGKIKEGSKIGSRNPCRIIFAINTQIAVIEFERIPNVFFSAESDTLQRLNDNAFYHHLAVSTQHLEILIPLFYQAIGYTFSFLTGGVAGLVADAATDYVIDKSVDVALSQMEESSLKDSLRMTASTMAGMISPNFSPNVKIRVPDGMSHHQPVGLISSDGIPNKINGADTDSLTNKLTENGGAKLLNNTATNSKTLPIQRLTQHTAGNAGLKPTGRGTNMTGTKTKKVQDASSRADESVATTPAKKSLGRKAKQTKVIQEKIDIVLESDLYKELTEAAKAEILKDAKRLSAALEKADTMNALKDVDLKIEYGLKNRIRELFGEEIATRAIEFNFGAKDFFEIVAVPRRGSLGKGAPVLDVVFKYQEKGVMHYIVVEVKFNQSQLKKDQFQPKWAAKRVNELKKISSAGRDGLNLGEELYQAFKNKRFQSLMIRVSPEADIQATDFTDKWYNHFRKIKVQK